MNKITVRRAANGYIVTDGGDFTPLVDVEPAAPHVFETFDALAGFLRGRMPNVEPQPATCRIGNQGSILQGVPKLPTDQIYCYQCAGKCKWGTPRDKYGNPKS